MRLILHAVVLDQISVFYITDLRTVFTVEKTPGGFTCVGGSMAMSDVGRGSPRG
jgi:hypothetical protein